MWTWLPQIYLCVERAKVKLNCLPFLSRAKHSKDENTERTLQGPLWHCKEAGYLSYQKGNMLAGYAVRYLCISE